MKREDAISVLEMLVEAKKISVAAIVGYANLKNHPAYAKESLPELLRAQEQNATALISQAEKIWVLIEKHGCVS